MPVLDARYIDVNFVIIFSTGIIIFIYKEIFVNTNLISD